MEIIELSGSTPYILINSCLEIHGACQHKPRFHRYHEQETPSADKRKKHEKVDLEAPNPSRRRINLIDPDGKESVGSHSHHRMEPYGFISVKSIELTLPTPNGAGKQTRRGPLLY
jgi:hypothetical protein